MIRATTVQSDGAARLPASLTADNLTLKAGGTATVAQGGTIKMNVTGTLTVEAGAVLDVTGLGYRAPRRRTGRQARRPGSPRRGRRRRQPWRRRLDLGLGPPGDTFDSVYMPHQGGGGGSLVRPAATAARGRAAA